ncbi:hypothetical protein MIR68_001009 [Amoeboaphelidium protococcarum]|nr:hypothetical protein MIR68_001009 [Amoeboaphelidium protococcarum]
MIIFWFGVASFLLPAVICESWSQVMLTRKGLNAADSYDLLYSVADLRRQCQPFMEDMVFFEPVRSDEINDNQYATNVGVPSYKLDISQFVKSLAAALERQINVADYVLCLFPFYNELMQSLLDISISSIKYVNQPDALNAPEGGSTGQILVMIFTQLASGQDRIQVNLGGQIRYSPDLLDLLPSYWIIYQLPAFLVSKLQDAHYAVAVLNLLKSSRYKPSVAALARTYLYATYVKRNDFTYQLFHDLLLPTTRSTMSDVMTMFCKFISDEDEKNRIQSVMELTFSVAQIYWSFKSYIPQQQQQQKLYASQKTIFMAAINARMTSLDVPNYVRSGFELLSKDQKLSIHHYKFLGEIYNTMSLGKLLATFDPFFGSGAVYDELSFQRQVLLAEQKNIPFEWIGDGVFKCLSYARRFELLADVFIDFQQYSSISDITTDFEQRVQQGEFDNSLVALLKYKLSEKIHDLTVSKLSMISVGVQIRYCLEQQEKQPGNPSTGYFCLLLQRISHLDTYSNEMPGKSKNRKIHSANQVS